MKNENTNETIEQTDVTLLTPFSKHPYHVRDDEELQALAESVREYGILTPIIARKVGDRIEVISGHRRRAAAIQAGLKTVPVIYRNVDDDEATIMMVDSNFQRENLLPSEKAFAYKMKLDAMKHQGKATSSQVATKCGKMDSASVLGNQNGESRDTVFRYIRLTYLIKPILDKVDGGEIALSPAVELSYLSKTAQDWLCKW